VEITIPHRFCGPPESGNGGWVSGTLATHVPTTSAHPGVTVRLAAPPPLDRPLTLVVDAPSSDAAPMSDAVAPVPASARLLDGDHLVASATASEALEGEAPHPVSLEDARAAEEGYEGLADHPFPTCFSCGTARDPDDALCLRPGPLSDGSGRYALTWVPREASVPLVWAALDCPGGWSAGIAGRPMVLGTMTTQVLALPEVGAAHTILAWQRGSQGRKHLSGTALYAPGGQVLARAEATWIAVDPSTIRPRETP
jgi:hypothetical protein